MLCHALDEFLKPQGPMPYGAVGGNVAVKEEGEERRIVQRGADAYRRDGDGAC